ncbi:major facilitator superfamily domain-containing protein 4A-like [Watersipora subatra]|uniref:major facilitator superfamily domain-containing protein 4A-like n=1 Tax=Watersipora subatra TaxID=2589382 RepID=UPI00355C58A0
MSGKESKTHSVFHLALRSISNVGKQIFSCKQKQQNASFFLWALFKQNAFITIGYFLLYFAFGMCIGLMGPTLEDLACYTKEKVNTVAWLFFGQTCCMVIGVFTGGVVSKWASPDFLLLVSIMCLPITLVVSSFSRRIDLLGVMMALMGLAMGVIDCLANLQLIHIYDKAVAPFLQTMHFCYGMGALISPLLAKNFLLNEDCSMLVKNLTELNADSSFTNSDVIISSHLDAASNGTQVYKAFWLIAIIQVPVVLYMAAVVIKMGLRLKAVNPEFKRLINSESSLVLQQLNRKERSKEEKSKLLNQWQKYLADFQGSYSISFSKALLLTIAACLMVFIYDGLQGHINEFAETYALKTMTDEGRENAVYLNVSFWAAYSLGRLLSIGLAIKLTPYFMLLLSIIGCQTASVLFLSSLGGESFPIVVAANVVLGLSMSSITPTTITMTEHFMDLTNVQMSIIIGGAALGEMILPVVEGQLIDDYPVSFVAMLAVMVALSWIVFAVFWLMGRSTQKYKAIVSPSFIWYNPNPVEPVDPPKTSQAMTEQDYPNEPDNSDKMEFDESDLKKTTTTDYRQEESSK